MSRSDSMVGLSDEEQDALRKAEKCFRLAAKAGTPEEAATATEMGNRLLVAYNLTRAQMEEAGGDQGRRVDEKLKGGHFEYQRDLWEEVARLNFCLYFNIVEIEKIPKLVPLASGLGMRKTFKDKRTRRHQIVGRIVNVRSAQSQAEYLEQAIERITVAECDERVLGYYEKWAMDWRYGMVTAIREKLRERRKHLMYEQQQNAEAEEKRQQEAGLSGLSTPRALTISQFGKDEVEANKDFMDPERHARRLKNQEEMRLWRERGAQDRADAQARWVKWAAENPQEAAAQEAEAKKRRLDAEKREARNAARRTGPRWSAGPSDKRDYSAVKAGYQRGQSVSIDRQTAAPERQKRIT